MFSSGKNIVLMVLLFLAIYVIVSVPVYSQVQRLHITGSYNENFMITPDLPEYKVLGSLYMN